VNFKAAMAALPFKVELVGQSFIETNILSCDMSIIAEAMNSQVMMMVVIMSQPGYHTVRLNTAVW
jgi:hypothetical protein